MITNDSISKSAVIAELNRMIEELERKPLQNSYYCSKINILRASIDNIESLPVQQTMESPMESIQDRLKELQHFKDSSVGLWCTDRPEIIPEEIRHLFFQLK